MKVYRNIPLALTVREIEVLELISYGKTTKEISKQLFVSINTVKTHKRNLFYKLNVKNTALMIRKAFEWKYLHLDIAENLNNPNTFVVNP